MGNLSSWLSGFVAPEEKRILMVGLDAAGKTTIIFKLKLGEVVTTVPTIGFNVKTVNYKNFNLTMWDVGGADKIRSLWRHYYQNMSCVIFVIDSADRDRVKWAKEELAKMLCEEALAEVPILIFANKQDLPNAMTCGEVEEELQMHRYLNSHPWIVQSCCAISGEGLNEGFNWLASPLSPGLFSKAKSAMN